MERTEPTPGGPFRDELDEAPRRYVVEHRGAPREVKVVIVVSLVLGHMFVPGLLAGLFGLPIYGVGLVSIPGLWLTAGTAVYSWISLWHAHGLGRAASAIDAVLGEELEVVAEASRYAGSTINSGAPSSTSDSSITSTAFTFARAGSPSPP